MKISNIEIHNDGLDIVPAGELFDQIEVFAGYAFNKSHAAEYSLIAFQAMWLKQNFPVEFYAAALSTVGEDKLQVLVIDAKLRGINVRPPDINISTNEFVIGNDTTLFIPFNRVQGISDRSGNSLLRERQKGPFLDTNDIRKRVAGRDFNSRQLDHLTRVGGLVRIEPGSLPADDESRLKDQMELMPGLTTGVIQADRTIPNDKHTLTQLGQIVKDIKAVDEHVQHVQPSIVATGKGTTRFMVITDAPGNDEEAAGVFATGKSFGYVSNAMKVVDLKKSEGYWTGLSKKKKDGRQLTAAEIRAYSGFLDRELELLKPPVIVCLGSNATRYMLPDLKGNLMDHIGRTFWDKRRQALIIVGFNPGMCHFDENRFDSLAEIFDLVRAVVSPPVPV